MTSLRVTSVIIFLNLSLTSSVNAQPNKFNVGIEGGPGVTQFYGSANLPLQEGIAGSFGASFQYNFPKILSIRTGLDYERRTWKTNIEYNPGYSSYPTFEYPVYGINRFDYLTIPVMARASFGKKVLFFVNAGPYISLLLRTVDVSSSQGPGQPYETSLATITDAYKRFDIGVSIGAGLEIPVRKVISITIEARNNIGFVNLPNQSFSNAYAYQVYYPMPAYNNGSIRSYATVFLLGFEYKFGMRNKS